MRGVFGDLMRIDEHHLVCSTLRMHSHWCRVAVCGSFRLQRIESNVPAQIRKSVPMLRYRTFVVVTIQFLLQQRAIASVQRFHSCESPAELSSMCAR